MASNLRRYIGPKRSLFLVFFLLLLWLIWDLRQQGMLQPDLLAPILKVHPIRSVVIFLGLYALSVLSPLPTLPFNLAAGLFWGAWPGAVIATLGSSMGAGAAFLVSRFLFGQLLARHFDSQMVTRLQEEFDAHGWRFIAFARIVPIFPTGPFNYLLGLTSVHPLTYIWTTLVFTFPPALAFSWIGHEAGSFMIEGEVASLIRLVVAVSAAISLPILLHFGLRLWRRLQA